MATSESQEDGILTSIYYAANHSEEMALLKSKIERIQELLDIRQPTREESNGEYEFLEEVLAASNQQLEEETDAFQKHEAALANKIVGTVAEVTDKIALEYLERIGQETSALKASLDNIKYDYSDVLGDISSEFNAIENMNEDNYVAAFKKGLGDTTEKINACTENLIKFEAEKKQRAQITECVETIMHQMVEKSTHFMEHGAKHKELIGDLNKVIDIIASNKFILDGSRIWMNTENEYKLAGKSNVIDLDNLGDSKQIDNIEADIKRIHENLEVISRNINTTIQEETKDTPLVPLKRARENDTLDPYQDGKKSRLVDLEATHQELADCLLPCKDRILHPLFPSRLEAAMTKIESILLNHQSHILNVFNQDDQTLMNPSLSKSIVNIVNDESRRSFSDIQKRLNHLENILS